jgi:tetratricopeptide (TPR) repeat protein
MRLRPVLSSHRRSLIAAPLVVGALALVASACGSSPASPGTNSGTSTTIPASKTTPSGLLTAGLTAQKSKNFSVAVADYKQVIALAPTSSTASYADYDLGDIAQIDQNDPSAAANYYKAAIALNPNFVNALYNLAIIVTASQPLQAQNYYEQVIALQPNNADAHLNLGFIYNSQGNKTEAHKEFTKATTLEPSLSSRIPAGA